MKLLIDNVPNIGQKFVAFFHDGSGCELFIREKDIEGNFQFISSCGDIFGIEIVDNYLYWIEIPSWYKFWFQKDV